MAKKSKEEIKRILDSRTLTSFGVSIATGLMLESIFTPTEERYDPKREIPNKVNLTDYPYWLINGYSLIRNIMSSCTEELPDQEETVDVVIEVLQEELYTIVSLVSNVEGITDQYLNLYIPEYDKLIKKFNNKKDIHIKYIQNNINAIDRFKKKLEDITTIVPIVRADYKLDSKYKRALITTSYVFDLLQSRELTLLESHTGVLKGSDNWYSKYHPIGKADMSRLPMVDMLLYLLGDKHLVRSWSPKIKNKVLELAATHNWTFRTTREKVYSNLHSDPDLSEILSKFIGF